MGWQGNGMGTAWARYAMSESAFIDVNGLSNIGGTVYCPSYPISLFV